MQKYLYLIFALAIFMGSCESDYTIKGKFTNCAASTIVVDKMGAEGFQTVATKDLDNSGEFTFNFPVNDINYYRITLNAAQSVILIIDQGESIILNADALNITQTYTVEGSENSILYHDYFMKFQKIKYSLDSLQTSAQNMRADNPRLNAMRQQFNDLSAAQIDMSKTFIDNNLDKFAVIAVTESLPIDQYMDYHIKVGESMAAKFPNSLAAINFNKRLDGYNEQMAQKAAAEKKVQVGFPPPEIIMDDPNGNPIALSSLKGKVVLVDFWASWCRPCRAESPNLVRMYNSYHSKGFEIYSVSLDQAKNSWIQAIQQDQLNWPNHVSELRYWQTSAVSTYGFSGIPFTVLLDKDGNVIAKNLRGAQLEQKIKEILG